MTSMSFFRPQKMSDDKFLKFHKEVLEASSCIKQEAFGRLLRNYRARVANLEIVIDNERSAAAILTLGELFDNQLGLYRNFARYVGALQNNTNEEWAAFAQRVCSVIQDGIVIEDLVPAEATVVVKRRILDVKTLGEDPNNAKVYESSDIKQRLERVEVFVEGFMAAYEIAQKRHDRAGYGTKAELRQECTKLFLVLTGNADLQSGLNFDMQCDKFLTALDKITHRTFGKKGRPRSGSLYN